MSLEMGINGKVCTAQALAAVTHYGYAQGGCSVSYDLSSDAVYSEYACFRDALLSCVAHHLFFY